MSALPGQRVLPNLYQEAKRGCIIAGSDWASPDATRVTPALRFDIPDDAPLLITLRIVWGAKAKPPVLS
jgi:hypothetical protein